MSSDPLKPNIDPDGDAKAAQILHVAREHQVTAGRGTNNHRSVDNVGRPCQRASGACGPRPRFVEVLDPTAIQQPRYLSLGPAPPSLAQNSSRNRRHNAIFQGAPVQSPKPPIATLGCYQRPRVVGDTGHRQEATLPAAGLSTVSAHANSCAVSSP